MLSSARDVEDEESCQADDYDDRQDERGISDACTRAAGAAEHLDSAL